MQSLLCRLKVGSPRESPDRKRVDQPITCFSDSVVKIGEVLLTMTSILPPAASNVSMEVTIYSMTLLSIG